MYSELRYDRIRFDKFCARGSPCGERGEDTVLILAVMAAGVLIGYLWLPEKLKKANTWLQLGCTVALVFCMGVLLGRRENLWEELGQFGLWSLLLAVVPMGMSALLVWGMTGLAERRKRRKERK